MRNKIRLDRASDCYELVNAVSKFNFPITLTDGAGFKVNAKSMMGALYTMEFSEIWIESEQDIYSAIRDFII